MASIKPDPNKRSYLLQSGCKDLIDVLQGVPPKLLVSTARVNVNGKIRAPKVRVIDEQGEELGIMPLAKALELAQSRNIDLVEIRPQSRPPICRIVDYGKFRYELSRRRKRKL